MDRVRVLTAIGCGLAFIVGFYAVLVLVLGL